MIVIGIIGILGAMGVIGGKEATNIAKVTNIVDGFTKIESLMISYYSYNQATSDAGNTNLDNLIDGIQAQIKDPALITDDSTPVARKYTISIITGTPEKWWLAYTLDENDVTTLGPILKTRATQMGFKSATAATQGSTEIAAYDGTTATIYMQVH